MIWYYRIILLLLQKIILTWWFIQMLSPLNVFIYIRLLVHCFWTGHIGGKGCHLRCICIPLTAGDWNLIRVPCIHINSVLSDWLSDRLLAHLDWLVLHILVLPFVFAYARVVLFHQLLFNLTLSFYFVSVCTMFVVRLANHWLMHEVHAQKPCTGPSLCLFDVRI